MKYPLFKVHVDVPAAMKNIKEVLESGFINEGEQVTQLTNEMQRYFGTRRLILTNSCTSALTMALKLCGIKGNGEESVLSTPMTCVATNCPIVTVGAHIQWVDINMTSGCMSPDDLRMKLKRDPYVKAVMCVAWAGIPPDLEQIREICNEYRVPLILDAAHAFDAKYGGRHLYEWADFTCFPSTTKITTASGQKKISDVTVGDLVLTSSGKFKPVINVLQRPYHGFWTNIKAGQAKISSTENHPIKVYRNGIDQWLPAKDIQVGDQVYVTTSSCTKCTNLVPYYVKTCKECYSESNRSLKKSQKISDSKRKHNRKTSRLDHHNNCVSPIMESYRKKGYRVIPLIHAIPDFLALKDGKIAAIEVENANSVRVSKATKYDKLGTDTYDDIQWHTLGEIKGKVKHQYEIDGPFARVPVWNVRSKYKTRYFRQVYNLTLSQDDPTYVAGNILVHNCYSFQAIKHVTTGDGGMLICADEEPWKRAKKMKWFGIDRDGTKDEKGNWKGQRWETDIDEAGYKFAMNNISAALGMSQIPHIPRIMNAHRENAEVYDDLFCTTSNRFVVPLMRPTNSDPSHWVYSMFVYDTTLIDRDKLVKDLNDRGIGAGLVHIPNDIYNCFSFYKDNLPGVREFAQRQLSLPVGWWLKTEDLHHIYETVQELCLQQVE